ncbi:MAG: HEAT repeat domain-containing protein [Pirellulales bacterium]
MTMRTLFAVFAIFCSIRITAAAEPIRLNKGDHIVILGNALAERMTHDGTLEALLYAAHPEHDLVIRNLGYSGDEIAGYTSKPDASKRLRSMDFGTADQWLKADAPIPQPEKLKAGATVKPNRFETVGTRPDVIIALFGYNESFAGEAGLPKFKETLTDFIRHVTTTKYNGKTPPKLLLCSPIAHEDLNDPHLPNGKENNVRLELYTNAMRETAEREGVRFVDLFSPAESETRQGPFTIDGVHLNDAGAVRTAYRIAASLAHDTPPAPRTDVDHDRVQALVRDKNFHWFQRYRATDGYSVHGDRAFIKFTAGQSNYEVGQRELETLDQLVTNREKAIWAAARGDKTAKPVDDNLPAFLPVVSNKPGKLPGGKHAFLGGDEAIEKMTIHKDMRVNLFASEEKFPELASPVQMAFDTKGRLWVAAWPTYPHWKPTEPMNDKLLIFEDTDNDGRADVCKTFAGDLHNPTGFEFWNGGVLVAQGPDVLFIKDTDGDDKYDVKERILHGIDTADTHHTANSFTLDPGGALYFQEGTFHHSQVETPWGPPRRVANGAVFRYEPRTKKFDVHVSYGFANPHGHAFDSWGQDIVVDGTGAVPYHGTLFSNAVEFPRKNGGVPSVYQQRTRPCSGLEYLSGDHFGKALQGTLLVPNVIGFQGILNYKIEDAESSFKGTELEPILYSSDPNFRPTDVETAPDGSIYFIDWHNPIIGHLQHNLRDPNRNREKGRVYRVTHKTNALKTPAKIAGEPIPALLKLLETGDARTRARVRIELSGRPGGEVIGATKTWLVDLTTKALEKSEALDSNHMLEGLWVHQSHNIVNQILLKSLLKNTDFRARAAAVKVLWAWRDRVPNVLDLLLTAAGDEHPRVRLEAIRAAAFLETPAAYEVLLVADDLPHDPYIDAVLREATKTLRPRYDQATKDGQTFAFRTPAGVRFALKTLSVEELLKRSGESPVALELLNRPGVTDEARCAAVAALASVESQSETAVVMNAIRALDARRSGRAIGDLRLGPLAHGAQRRRTDGRPSGVGNAGQVGQATAVPADRARFAVEHRQVDRQSRRLGRSLARATFDSGFAARDAADLRPCAPYRVVSDDQRFVGRDHPARPSRERGPLCPHRTPGPRHVDPGRSRSLRRRPQHRPRRQSEANEHGFRRRRVVRDRR